MTEPPPSGLAGLSPSLDGIDEQVYRGVLRHPGRSRDELAGLLGRAYDEVAAAVRRLARLGLVELDGPAIVGLPPADVFGGLVAEANRQLQERERQLDGLRAALPSLLADYGAGETAAGPLPAIEVVAGIEAVNAVLADLSAHPDGEMLILLRPPMAAPTLAAAGGQISEPGVAMARKSRAVYRADFFEQRDWWDVVRNLAGAGEAVRVAATVPTKMLLVTGHAAMLPLDFETQDNNNGLLVRHPAMLAVLEEMFELVWGRAVAVSSLDAAAGGPARHAEHELLTLLASGAKDETIARQLDLSLRTVRRRVADLLEELDARTRFQAGVQAVHRGWV